jgi:hypothetical protein
MWRKDNVLTALVLHFANLGVVRILLEVHGAGNIVVDPDKTNKCRLYKEKMLFLINRTNVERATFDFDGKDARIFRENFIFDMVYRH